MVAMLIFYIRKKLYTVFEHHYISFQNPTLSGVLVKNRVQKFSRWPFHWYWSSGIKKNEVGVA